MYLGQALKDIIQWERPRMPVVVQLQAKLASMSNNFKEVLEVRTENLKEGKSRQDMFAAQG